MQRLYLADTVTRKGPGPRQTNRSSRRSDACHLCSLQSWKVKKAYTAFQHSLYVNITYSSDYENSPSTHYQAADRLASFFICADLDEGVVEELAGRPPHPGLTLKAVGEEVLSLRA